MTTDGAPVAARLMSFYLSRDRVLGLLESTDLPLSHLQALQGIDVPMASALLSNSIGNYLLDAIAAGDVRALQQLALDGSLAAGMPFICNGHFYGKGFGADNKSSGLMLTERLDDPLEGKKLVIEFSKSGLLNDTAYSRMSGSTRLFVYAYVAEITDDTIRAIPFAIGDLVTRTPGMSLPFASSLQLRPTNIDQFSSIDPHWMPSKTEFQLMREVPEQKVKETIAAMLGEVHVPADWGGEESDLYSGALLVDGQRRTGAFLLKGPARFHPMTMRDLGKNGDQVYRLFNPPADIYVVQHCHTIGPAVRKTVEAFALHRSFVAPCRFMFIDGYDTARLLRAAGEWPALTKRSPRKR